MGGFLIDHKDLSIGYCVTYCTLDNLLETFFSMVKNKVVVRVAKENSEIYLESHDSIGGQCFQA